jgi:hypothetical protein
LQNIQTELDIWNLFSSPDSITTIQKLDSHSKPTKLSMSTMQQPNYKVEKLSKRKWVLKWQTGKETQKKFSVINPNSHISQLLMKEILVCCTGFNFSGRCVQSIHHLGF